MKKILFTLLLLFSFSCLAATPYKKIVFFGDSLSDNGNLYRASLGLMPKSPPYFEGRYTNGYTWADIVGDHYNKTYGTQYLNYAVGGSSVVLRNPFDGYLPYDLFEVINNYLIPNLFADKSQILFVIWSGAIDYFNGQKDVEKSTDEVINEFIAQIDRLIYYGAKHFLILNIPDLSHTPFGMHCDYKENLHILSVVHNEKLKVALKKVRQNHTDVKIFEIDTLGVLDEILTNPEKYNQLYNKKLTNLSDPCWTGGYTYHKNNLNDIMTLRTELKNIPNINNELFATYLLSSPSTAEAYAIGKQFAKGAVPCEKPDEYVFWDKVHPSAAVHQILAEIAIKTIN